MVAAARDRLPALEHVWRMQDSDLRQADRRRHRMSADETRSPSGPARPAQPTWPRSSTPRAPPGGPRGASSPTRTCSPTSATRSWGRWPRSTPPADARRCCSCRSRTCSRGSSRSAAWRPASCSGHCRGHGRPAARPGVVPADVRARRAARVREGLQRRRAARRRPTARARSSPARRATAVAYSEALDTAGGPGLRLRAEHAVFDRLVYSKLRAAARRPGAVWRSPAARRSPPRLGHFFRGVGVTDPRGVRADRDDRCRCR